MKQNKTLNRILIVSLLGVWGTIVYQIVDANKADESNVESNRPAPRESVQTAETVAFDTDVRDPFRYYPRIAQTRPKASESQNISSIPPRLTLTGIVSNGSKRVAVLEDPTGKVEFSSEGDSIQGVLIKRILDTKVEYIHMKRTHTWYLTIHPTISDHSMTQ